MLKRKHILIILSVLLLSMLTIAAVFAVDGQPKKQRLPVVMYHQVMSTGRRNGRYTVSAELLENDLKYLRDRGYRTVDVQDIIDYVYRSEDLPEKCIMLTFDDGFESIYAIVEPLMKKYGMCCVSAVLGSMADLYTKADDHNLSYSYMTWDEIRELSQGDTVEIQNHSYNMHFNVSGKRKGMRRMRGESTPDYTMAVTDDMAELQQKLTAATGITPTAMVYPLGEYNELLCELVRELGFKASFVCEERVNTLTRGDSHCLYNLGRYNRPSNIETEKFFSPLLG